MKDIARFSLILFLICSVAAGLLALVFKVTEPQITLQRQLEEKRAIKEVLGQTPEVIERTEKEDLVLYKARDAKGNLIAYVFITQVHGYSSDIRTAVSLKPKGDIIAIKILEQCETPGIGSRITEDEFLNQFKNKNVDVRFDTITGATISSRAVINLVKKKTEEIKTLIKNER